MGRSISISGLLVLSVFVITCTTSTPKMAVIEPAENSGHVVLETFVGKQVPTMHVDLLSWDLLADSVIAISGNVLDANHAVVPGVTICLLDEKGAVLTEETKSGADGAFVISSKEIDATDHILFKHDDYETLDLVIKELRQSSEGMLVKFERVILP